jgi:hypothetical protein
MEGIKVGDWVLIKSNRFTDHLTRVTKVTSKQFVTTKGSRFLKKNGRLIGSGEWNTMYACIPSQCDVHQLLENQQKHKLITKLTLASEDQVREYIELREKKALIKTIQSHLQEYKEIPVEVLESVVNLLES